MAVSKITHSNKNCVLVANILIERGDLPWQKLRISEDMAC